ncbi:MAG TPA: DUF3376 domain-containing protein, partial [Microcoleaceae cyanobacterium]
IEIDVITGASAGAMTACILAQKLLFDGAALRQPYDNALYHSWVEDVDIEKLLQFNQGENPNLAIFSSDLIAEIGKRYLLDRYASVTPTQSPHPASAKQIYLGLAMSNLNGVDYAVNLNNFMRLSKPDANERPSFYKPNQVLTTSLNQLNFVYTRHKDCFIKRLSALDDHQDIWQKIELIGRSSGAFPFAFRVLEVERKPNDPTNVDERATYQGSVLSIVENDLKSESDRVYKFAYTDGGVFENEPLGMAKNLVDKLDPGHRDYKNRFYLYVAPGAKGSTTNTKFTAEQAVFLETAKALTGAIFTQARFQDWIMTSQINQELAQFQQQANRLKQVLQTEPAQQQNFDGVADTLLHTLYHHTGNQSQTGVLDQTQDFERLKHQFAEDYSDLAQTDPQLANTWLKTIQILEKLQNLGPKDPMKVYTITSENVELAGEELSAFGGFFDRKWRDYDYFIGRTKAIWLLENLQKMHQQGQGEAELYLTVTGSGQDLRHPDVDYGNVNLNNIRPEVRRAVRDRLLDRLSLIVDSFKTNFIIRALLKFSLWLFLAKYIDEEVLQLQKPSLMTRLKAWIARLLK